MTGYSRTVYGLVSVNNQYYIVQQESVGSPLGCSSVGERYSDYGSVEPRFGCKVRVTKLHFGTTLGCTFPRSPDLVQGEGSQNSLASPQNSCSICVCAACLGQRRLERGAPSADGSCVSTAPPGPAAIGKRTRFQKIAPVAENQHRRSTSAAFQRDLELAAPRRRKGWGERRQRCTL